MNKKKIAVITAIIVTIIVISVTTVVLLITNTDKNSRIDNETTSIERDTTERTTSKEDTAEETTTEEDSTEEETTTEKNTTSTVVGYKSAYIDIINKFEDEYPDSDYTYNLIYFNDDDIPELVVAINGYVIYMYTFDSGYVYEAIDGWPYGAMGNTGYEYIPYQNVLRNYDSDFAGALIYETYMKLNENNEMVDYHDNYLNMRFFKDLNGDSMPSDDEYTEDGEAYYFYGDTEITEEEYNSYVISGDYEYIEGKMNAYEIIGTLE